MFHITEQKIDTQAWHDKLHGHALGGVVTFEGRIRNQNSGRTVLALEYDIFPELAEKEGLLVLKEASAKFPIEQAYAIHRYGKLALGEVAVFVGVGAVHRDEAFTACRFIIDEIKSRVPIWKREFYDTGKNAWVGCPACEKKGSHASLHLANCLK